MDNDTYIKGIYTANVRIELSEQGRYQGVVILSRDDGGNTPESVRYEVEACSASEEKAIEEARSLAHRILGTLEL